MDALVFDALNVFLLGCLVVTALAIARLRGLFTVAMLSGIYSLLCASVFVLLDAVDVAFTEAAVGAGMTTVLFLATFGLTRSKEHNAPHERRLPALLTAVACGGVLLYAFTDMPTFGDANTPVQAHPIAERYIETTHDEVGIPNMVTTLLASYRGFDTLGEVVVVFTAGIAVLMLLGRSSRERAEPKD